VRPSTELNTTTNPEDRMFKLKPTLFAVAVTVATLIPALVAVNALGAQFARQHHGSQRIAVRETATFTSQIDNAPSGPSAGDAFTFTGTLVGQRNGTEQGSCTFVTATRAQCSISAFFADGQLVFNGALPFDQTDFQIPLTGGTGEFSRARGFVTVHVTNATGTVDDLVMHIFN
jgi:hypothetical protein